MDSEYQAAMKLVGAIAPVPTGPVRLSPEYLESVERVEGRPDNRSGSDKSWVGRVMRRNRDFFERARLR